MVTLTSNVADWYNLINKKYLRKVEKEIVHLQNSYYEMQQ